MPTLHASKQIINPNWREILHAQEEMFFFFFFLGGWGGGFLAEQKIEVYGLSSGSLKGRPLEAKDDRGCRVYYMKGKV